VDAERVLGHLYAVLAGQQSLFATRGADKFGGGSFAADESGLPVLDQAGVTLRCSSYAKVPGGHLILVGRVEHTQMIAPEIHSAVYFRRTFHRLPSNRTELGT
jgi:flavin reductase ActVB